MLSLPICGQVVRSYLYVVQVLLLFVKSLCVRRSSFSINICRTYRSSPLPWLLHHTGASPPKPPTPKEAPPQKEGEAAEGTAHEGSPSPSKQPHEAGGHVRRPRPCLALDGSISTAVTIHFRNSGSDRSGLPTLVSCWDDADM